VRKLILLNLLLTFGIFVNASEKGVYIQNQIDVNDSYHLPNPVIDKFCTINIEVSPQIELMSIVQAISKYQSVFDFLMIQDAFQYKNEITASFYSFRNHPVIQMFDSLSLKPGMLNFSAPSSIMLYLDEGLNIRKDIAFDDFIIKRVGGIDSLLKFSNLLKDFAQKSSFNKYFIEHTDFYKKIISETKQALGSNNLISEIENFYGEKQRNYTLCLVSLYNYVGFGNSIVYKNNDKDIFNVMGTSNLKDNIPSFGDNDYLKYMIRHEFSHPFVNSLTNKYWNNIEKYSSKFDSIPDVAKKKVCGDWQECINEFVIRAISVHLAYGENVALGHQIYEKEKSKGVYCLDDLLFQIKQYEKNRNQFPTFDSYYINILEVFKKPIK
jgi:hypothetical protein